MSGDENIAYGPLKVIVFQKITTHVSSSDCQTLVIINTDKNSNLAQGGVAFQQEDEGLIIVYDK